MFPVAVDGGHIQKKLRFCTTTLPFYPRAWSRHQSNCVTPSRGMAAASIKLGRGIRGHGRGINKTGLRHPRTLLQHL